MLVAPHRISSALGRLLPPARGQLLQRVRFQFLLLTVAVSGIGMLDLQRVDTLVSLPAYAGALVGLVVWAAALYRHGDHRWWLDLMGPVLVTCFGVAAGHYGWAFGAMYAALFLQCTYGGARRTAINAVLYLVAYEVSVTLTEGAAVVVGGLASHAIGIFVVAYLIRTIARSVRQHDDNRRREHVLTRGGANLLTATSPCQVVQIALAAAVEVVASDAPHRVTLWRLRNDVLEMAALAGLELTTTEVPLDLVPAGMREAYLAGEVIRLDRDRMAALQHSMGVPAEFSRGLSIPLVEGGRTNGLLFISTNEMIDPDTVVALERFMHEVSLADALVRRQELLAGVVDNSADGILLVGRGDVIEFASPAVSQLTGRDASSVVGQPISTLLFRRLAGERVPVHHLAEVTDELDPLFTGDGDDERQVDLAVSPVNDDAVVVNLRDVTERRRLQEEVSYRAFHDPVTGLANRALFGDRLEHALDRASREGARVAVAMIDIDDFKAVNDVHGHSAGDDLLVETAQRLTEALRRSDTCARFGGDEFAVLMEGIGDAAEVVAVLDRVAAALREPFAVGDRRVSVSASVGVRIGSGRDAAEVLVGDSDVAMYVAKAKGKDQLVLFEEGMRLAALERLELRSELQAAIADEQLVLHYQPTIDLETGAVTGFEALVRWSHPVRGLVPPDSFIPIAEQSGLILPLGQWVLHRACEQLADWQAAGSVRPDMRMSVNLSAVQLLSPCLIEDVATTLQRTGLRPQQLVLEVTETALMGEPDRAGDVLVALTALGVAVAIDDFGTGYSSFAYLQRFCVDIIKVDRSFVARITDGPEQAALAHAIIKLAQTLRISTVAEGVEEVDQADLLRRWGCELGQGWLWARAMPAEDVEAWLDRTGHAGRSVATGGSALT